jgi:metal-responsive CopG/Arc/MetJ family transcriptional regulator
MLDKKKLIGVYLPIALIARLKKFIYELFSKTGVDKSQSEIIEEALGEYLDKKTK